MSKKEKKSIEQKLIEEKREKLEKSIREYWDMKDELDETLHNNLKDIGLDSTDYKPYPKDLSSFIYLLNDGAVFIRFKVENYIKGYHKIIENKTLDNFIDQGLLIPLRNKNIIIPSIKVIDTSFVNTDIKVGDEEFHVEYLIYNHLKYDDKNLIPSFTKALLDYRVTILGLSFYKNKIIKKSNVNDKKTIIERLETQLHEFETLLDTSPREEELQIFLKENPYLLKISSEFIPKQKLGEDFITDFVLIELLDQGNKYTLVEIEKSSHNILTKDGQLTNEVNKALTQISDWRNWIEKNKNYMAGKIKDFETPNYMIVIGRTKEFDVERKEKLRSYNRGYSDVIILSYDDLIMQTKEWIRNLKSL
ncbi:MAG: DUF4263 domain-containing protein [Ignavibacteria bacterium]|nr:DUF4263 domain-containing protein [Ignavibacteria bacterium]